jgi:hypothetical protein
MLSIRFTVLVLGDVEFMDCFGLCLALPNLSRIPSIKRKEKKKKKRVKKEREKNVKKKKKSACNRTPQILLF